MSIFFTYILTLASMLCTISTGQEEVIEHKVEVNHPAFEKGTSTSFILKEVESEASSSEFYLEVESVICVDHICKIVPVRIYWNAYGEYIRYELDKDIRLEKGEGEPFIDEDYRLLHKILKDKDSPYRDISYYEITHERVIGESQIDAISGATETVLKNGETVVGAAWTCFTLWHWVHGEIVQEIRRISGQKLSLDQLLENLKSKVVDYRVFAINELKRRKNFDPLIIAYLIDVIPNETKEINKHAVQYIEQAPSAHYLAILGKLYANANQENRMLYLRSLSQSKVVGDQAYYDVFTKDITNLKSFQEIDIILNIVSNSKVSPSQLQQISGLLNHKNFIFARRAYWFLSKQELSAVSKMELKEFYKKNYERL